MKPEGTLRTTRQGSGLAASGLRAFPVSLRSDGRGRQPGLLWGILCDITGDLMIGKIEREQRHQSYAFSTQFAMVSKV